MGLPKVRLPVRREGMMGGRPRLSDEEKRSVIVQVRFRPDEYDALCTDAIKAHGPRVSVAAYFRGLLLRAREVGVSVITKPRGASR